LRIRGLDYITLASRRAAPSAPCTAADDAYDRSRPFGFDIALGDCVFWCDANDAQVWRRRGRSLRGFRGRHAVGVHVRTLHLELSDALVDAIVMGLDSREGLAQSSDLALLGILTACASGLRSAERGEHGEPDEPCTRARTSGANGTLAAKGHE
jgi:hypothetical protein